MRTSKREAIAEYILPFLKRIDNNRGRNKELHQQLVKSSLSYFVFRYYHETISDNKPPEKMTTEEREFEGDCFANAMRLLEILHISGLIKISAEGLKGIESILEDAEGE